jgi:hypothetical protein
MVDEFASPETRNHGVGYFRQSGRIGRGRGQKRQAGSAAASSLFSVPYRALPVSHATEVILDHY